MFVPRKSLGWDIFLLQEKLSLEKLSTWRDVRLTVKNLHFTLRTHATSGFAALHAFRNFPHKDDYKVQAFEEHDFFLLLRY